jgi:hypothetical protein
MIQRISLTVVIIGFALAHVLAWHKIDAMAQGAAPTSTAIISAGD